VIEESQEKEKVPIIHRLINIQKDKKKDLDKQEDRG
jgi:hypothetical protein